MTIDIATFDQSYREPTNENSGHNDSAFFDKSWPLRTVVGITCILSFLGSLIIIVSYYFRDLRTRARWILLHLSIMDLGVAVANFTGDVVNFDRYYYNGSQTLVSDWHPPHVPTSIHMLCVAQAFLALYFTLGAVLWTGCLAVHMYLLILYQGRGKMLKTKFYLYFSYLFTYGVPLIISLWLALTQRLGYAPYDSSGWCSIICKKPDGETDIFTTVFGYDMWMYGTILIILVVYFSVHFYLREYRRKLRAIGGGAEEAMHNVDYKFIVIPLVFILLRIWTQITDAILIYAGRPSIPGPPWVATVLLYLSGIGDSGQGFANAVLFVAFTKNVRKKFRRLLRRCCCFRGQLADEWDEALRGSRNYYSITHPSTDSEMSQSCEVAKEPQSEGAACYEAKLPRKYSMQKSTTTQGSTSVSYPYTLHAED